MSDLEKAIKMLDGLIKDYRLTNPDDGQTIVTCMQEASSILYYLEGQRAIAHSKFQNKVKAEVDNGSSVARAENEAHVLVPEMYLLRHKIDSGYEALRAMGMQLSWIKTGLTNT